MSRDAGFDHADVDVGLLDDDKVRGLVRSTRDEGLIARAIVGYLAAVLGSWAEGNRVRIKDAAPLWLTGIDDLADRLIDAGFLDGDGRIVEKAWASWFEPARKRRDDNRDRWARYNARRAAAIDGNDAVGGSLPRGRADQPRGSDAVPSPAPTDLPSAPPDPSFLHGASERDARHGGRDHRRYGTNGRPAPALRHDPGTYDARMRRDDDGPDCPRCGCPIRAGDLNTARELDGAVAHLSCPVPREELGYQRGLPA